MSSLSNHYFEIRIKIKNIYILLQTDMDEHIIDLEEIVEKQAWQLYMTSRKKGFPKKRKEVNIEFDWSGVSFYTEDPKYKDITVLTCVCVCTERRTCLYVVA
jgi:lysozyme family protein